ncbi:aspartic protease PEP1 [Mytilinidion resinicola]|uniref:Aspartic protease PEP1 n=1 Tax=Mytilinidion resinicola TaxID=574789 RepID=A0A6A6Z5G1_9PEZI|nr:aspartic protease PEP1 [Mytilinidion resinicola]KAF2816068.1 aspartic protease PEP1 [Mytilinidion resinicola]
MPSFASLTALVAVAGLVAASPVSLEKRKAFTVEQVEKGKFVRNGAASVASTYLKYGKPVPANVAAAAAAQGSVTASPSDDYDSSYLCPVDVGGTTMELDFDTGSADLWVFSSLQPSSQTSGHAVYQASSSKIKSGYTWDISYGDGSGASGKVYADKVVVGGVTATSQAVEAATSISTQFQQDTNNDGLLGLSFSSINTVKPKAQTTFFDTVKSTLAKPLFGVDLKYHAPGTYDFGFIDTSKFSGALTYVDVDNSQGFWGFTASGYIVGNGTQSSTSISAIADTGTTLLYIPLSAVKAYYKQVSGAKLDSSQGGYTFPCSASLPDFTAIIGGTKHTVPGKYINYSPISDGSSTCFGGIQDDSDIGQSIFGDIFLKSQYVVFNGDTTPKLGFAQQV